MGNFYRLLRIKIEIVLLITRSFATMSETRGKRHRLAAIGRPGAVFYARHAFDRDVDGPYNQKGQVDSPDEAILDDCVVGEIRRLFARFLSHVKHSLSANRRIA